MAEYPLIQTARQETEKLATLELKLWQLVDEHKYAEISKTEVVRKDENGNAVKDEKKKVEMKPEDKEFAQRIDSIVAKEGIEAAKEFLKTGEMQAFFEKNQGSKERYERYTQQFKIAPEGEAFIYQIDAIVAEKGVEAAKKFIQRDEALETKPLDQMSLGDLAKWEMQAFFKDHPNTEKGYKAYVDQYDAIGQQSDKAITALKNAGLSAEEAVNVAGKSGKIIELVDTHCEEQGASGKGFSKEKIAGEALNATSFPQRAATLEARDMLRDTAKKDGVADSISVQDVMKLTSDQRKKLDVDGNGLDTRDLDKIYAGFSDDNVRGDAVEKLANVLRKAGVEVADYVPPSTGNVPQGAAVNKELGKQ